MDTARQLDCIVIGAGVAGLAAAQSLCKAGCKSLLILEARDRIGGRILTQELLGIPMDLGASWIRGTKDNPLMNIPFRLKGLENVVIFDKDNRKIEAVVAAALIETVWAARQRMIDSRKKSSAAKSRLSSSLANEDSLIDSDKLNRRRKSWWDRVRKDMEAEQSSEQQSMPESDELRNISYASDISLSDWLRADPQFCAEIERNKEHGYLLLDLVNMLENLEGADLNVISLANHDKNDFVGPHLYVTNGLWDLIRVIGGSILKEQRDILKLEHEVVGIDYSAGIDSDYPVQIHTNKGVFSAKTVIITLPIGILQARHTELFYPPLPERHQHALSSVAVGLMDKVILEFSHCFWPPEVDGFWSFLPAPGIRRGMDFDEGEEAPGLVWFVNMEKMHRSGPTEGPPVLIGHVSQRHARRIEEMDDEEVEHLFLGMLRQCFAKAVVPDLLSFRITRWGMDPYSMGACTYLPVGTSASLAHIITLSEPVAYPESACAKAQQSHCQPLHFAGEHTSPHHFGTVHGALMSGIVEAESVAFELGLIS
ncbi:hypothetical protein HDU78_009073 [Chytriomyces hyalinus]|nr:hypothetical protein HDU78_009073 [Chytriomyces hyalinus]